MSNKGFLSVSCKKSGQKIAKLVSKMSFILMNYQGHEYMMYCVIKSIVNSIESYCLKY